MNTKNQAHARHAATLLFSAIALAAIATLTGCNGSGQSEVTAEDRPAEGAGWAVQEQMAGQQGQ